MAVSIEFLKALPYFTGLSPAELDAVKGLVSEKVVERGESVLREDEPAKALYFVVSGAIKVFKTSVDGKEQVLSLARPGDSFNDVPVFEGGLNLASAVTMGPVVLYAISKSSLGNLIRQQPQLALNVINVLSRKVKQLVALVEGLSFMHVNGRVAKILLEYAGDGADQKSRLTQQDMAAMAGTAREMVSRALKDLEEEGVIRLDHHRIVIRDKKALQGIAGVAA